MPYAKNSDLPKSVRSSLPEEAQTIFRKAYNAIVAAKPDMADSTCFKRAWTEVSSDGWSPPESGSGKWTKDEFGTSDSEVVDSFDVRETIAFDAGSDIRTTDAGYLVAMPRIARTGIQIYKGKELGRPEMDDVRVYRPEAVVFAKDSLHSYAGRPITNDHPPVLVNSKNWKKFSVGILGSEVLRDGDYIRVPTMFMDHDAVRDVQNGKRQLSLGYTMDLKWESGRTPTGEAYDAFQTDIRANHLALVRAARGGSALAIGDQTEETFSGDVVRRLADEIERRNRKEKDTMTEELKSVTIDGLAVAMTDMASKVVERHLLALQKQIDTLSAKLKEEEETSKKSKDAIDESAKAIATKDAEIATLKKQLEDAKITPAALDTLVKERAEIAGKARALIGDKLVVDGKTVADMRKQVVDVKLGDTAKGWTEDAITASFNTLAAGVKVDDAGQGNGVDRLADALSGQPQHGISAADKAYDEYNKRLQSAWKNPQPAQTN
jgi:cation transport regulator ChaB